MDPPTDTTQDEHEGYEGGATVAIVLTFATEGLPVADRCDRCGGQAFIMARLPTIKDKPLENRVLLFCAHHGSAAMPKLLDMADMIHDHRPYLEAEEKRLMPPSVRS